MNNSLIKEFVNYFVTIRGKQQSSAIQYEKELESFNDFLKSNCNLELQLTDIQNITLTNIHEYISYLSSEKGNSRNSRAKKMMILKSFFKYLSEEMNYIEKNPAEKLKTPKKVKTVKRTFTKEEVKLFIDSLKNYKYKTIFILLINTGMRLAELLSLNVKDVFNSENEVQDVVVITGKGEKQREIYLNGYVKEILKDFIKTRTGKNIEEDALFINNSGKRLKKRYVQKIIEENAEKLGLEGITTHRTRNTFATILYELGYDITDIKEILGHEKIETTEGYINKSNERRKNAVMNLNLGQI